MGTRMTVERMEAYAQVIEVLNHMDKQYINKIPLKLQNFFENNCSKESNFEIDFNKPLKEQNLTNKTLDILAMLNINFWCETEEHKQELIALYSENEKKYQEELSRQYNVDNIFKNKHESNEFIQDEQETILVKVEPIPLYKRIIMKIRSFLKI